MSVYNDAAYLAQAVESILNQSFRDFEFLIFNDGSTDGSKEILEELANKDNRIKLINQENIGLTKTLNRGLSMAQGEYIARMDSNDISVFDRLEKEVKFLDDNKDFAVVGSFTEVIDDNGKNIGFHKPAVIDTEIKKLSFFSGQLTHSSVMFRKKEIVALGGYDENIKYAQDADLWFRIMGKYKVANIPEYLLKWRKTAGGISVKKIKDQLKFAQKAKVRAIKNGLYPRYYYLFLLWPYMRSFFPVGLKNHLKKLFK